MMRRAWATRLATSSGSLTAGVWREPDGGAKLERTHSPLADVQQSLHGAQRPFRLTSVGEIPLDHGVAEPVGQRVGENAGQATECFEPCQLREGDGAGCGQRELEGGDLEPLPYEVRTVLERDDAVRLFRHRPDQLIPEPDLSYGNAFSHATLCGRAAVACRRS